MDIENKNRINSFIEDNTVTDESGTEVSPLDDNYHYYHAMMEDLTNPLSDDYNKYDNE